MTSAPVPLDPMDRGTTRAIDRLASVLSGEPLAHGLALPQDDNDALCG